jgi:hypothetical protein
MLPTSTIIWKERVQKVSDQNAGRVAEGLVGRGPATAQRGFVHHIVVQQGRGVDQLHHGGQDVFALGLVAQGAGDQQQQAGRRRLPPAAMMYWEICAIRGTLVVSR